VLVRTYEKFPDPRDRYHAELSFYHYRLAARTNDPQKWMQMATENEWSTREMAQAIKINPIQSEYREAERLLFKVKSVLADPEIGKWFEEKLLLLIKQNKCVLEDSNAIANA